MPDELIRTRPVLSTGYGWALLDTGDLDAAEPRLQDAERWLARAAEITKASDEESDFPTPKVDGVAMVVVDKKEFQSLPATIASARAYLAQARGDLPSAEVYAQRALDLLPADDHFYRGIPAVIMGLAYWSNGALAAASRSFSDAITNFQMADNHIFAVNGTAVLAAIKMAQGRLHEAYKSYQQALQRVAEQRQPMPSAVANLHRGISEIQREWGDLEAAIDALSKSQALGQQAALSEAPYRYSVALALVKKSQGDFDGALDLLDEAAQRYQRDRLPDIRPIAALKTRIWLQQGRLADALGWARQQNLAYDDDLGYLREFEHITLARILIAQYNDEPIPATLQRAQELLARLLQAAEDGGRGGSVIDILVVQALAHQAAGNSTAARTTLQQALALAAPEGYISIFVDEGPIMAALLHQAAQEGGNPAYMRQLQDACGKGAGQPPVMQGFVEPLNEREVQILRLAAAGYKNKEIASELVISLNTVLYHTKNLYGKLGVNKRTLAIIKARELGYL
ncbi:MAG: LuxR C-terminal-related transcriptional regulator [Caldilineaceae bacterium]